MPGLGRRSAEDSRDQNYPLRATLEERGLLEAKLPRSVIYNPRSRLDQGETGTCVGHGWKNLLMARPFVRAKGARPSAFDIYCRATVLDEFSDNDVDCGGSEPYQAGSSTRAGAKALQEAGYISEYRWATSLDDIRTWMLAGHGPIVIGIKWYEGMFSPDASGILQVSGAVAGGHCILVGSLNDDTKLAGLCNSWGRSWGKDGWGYLHYADLERLLFKEQGEAVAAIETRGGNWTLPPVPIPRGDS